MRETGKNFVRLLTLVSTISFAVYCLINAVFAISNDDLQSKEFPYPGSFRGYVRHINGKCLTVVGSNVELRHCVRGTESQIFYYNEEGLVQQSTGHALGIAERNTLGFIDIKSNDYKPVMPMLNNKLSWAGQCIAPEHEEALPCDGAKLVSSTKSCRLETSYFYFITVKEYDKEHWYMFLYSPWSCAQDICSLNYLGTSFEMCSNCGEETCDDITKCVTVVVQTDNIHLTIKMLKSFLGNVVRSANLQSIIVIYSADANESDKPRIQLQKLSPKIITYKTLSGIGEAARLNAALTLVKTPYFLLLEQNNVFLKDVNLDKMFHILQNTNSNLVAGYPQGGYFGLLYVRQMRSGAQLVFGSYVTKTSTVIGGYTSCKRVDFFPRFYMASTAAFRKIGGWTQSLQHYSHLEMFLKIKSGHLNPVVCTDLSIATFSPPLARLPRQPLDDKVYQHRLMEVLGLDSLVFCETTNTAGGILTCNTIKWQIEQCVKMD